MLLSRINAFYFLMFCFFICCSKIEKFSPSIVSQQVNYSILKNDSSAFVSFIYKPNQLQSPYDSSRGYQSVPTVGYQKGTIFIAYMAGHKGEEIGNYIVVSTSNDAGKSWVDELIITPLSNGYRCIDPIFWNEPNGNIHLSWTSTANFYDGGKIGNYEIGLKSDSDFLRITKPKKLFSVCQTTKPYQSIQYPNTLFFCTSGWTLNLPGATYVPSNLSGPSIYSAEFNNVFSDSFRVGILSRIPTPSPPIYYRDFDEPMAVELGIDTIHCLLRSANNGTYETKSFDGGNTWLPLIPFTKVGNTTSARVSYSRLKSGNLLLILNNSKGREKMTAFLSNDNGNSWPYKILIKDTGACSYPDVTQDENGKILLTFDYNRYPMGRIFFTTLTESMFFSTTPVLPQLNIVSKIY